MRGVDGRMLRKILWKEGGGWNDLFILFNECKESECDTILMCMGVIDDSGMLHEKDKIKREEIMKVIWNLKNGKTA